MLSSNKIGKPRRESNLTQWLYRTGGKGRRGERETLKKGKENQRNMLTGIFCILFSYKIYFPKDNIKKRKEIEIAE